MMKNRTDLLLEIADDELILGWRNSEWTGIAPFLEEDVAFSSIAQNEIGHARALYELAARDLGTTADALALDRKPEEYRSAPLVELRRLEWARTIARHWLYETADQVRIESMKRQMEAAISGLGARPEVEVVSDDSWSTDRITAEGREKLRAAGFAPPAPREAFAPTLLHLQSAVFRCPYCGSTEPRLENLFGPA